MQNPLIICEQYKDSGNSFLKSNQLNKAIQQYTKAIEQANKYSSIPNDKISIYYANRSFCQIKLENYGLALRDANESIKLNPSYIKAYYRSGSSYLVLSKFKQAFDAFSKAFELSGNKDEYIYQKLKEVKIILTNQKKQTRLKIFEGYGRVQTKTADWKGIDVGDYSGPKLNQNQNPTSQWVIKMMEYLKDQKKLHKRYVLQIIEIVKNKLEKYSSLVDFKIQSEQEMTVCGDIHGQYYDLLNIFKINGNPGPENKYLFNGDFVDRGSFSVQCILTLIAWKAVDNNIMHLTRGNHQAKAVNMIYGFKGEVQSKYGPQTYQAFTDLFCNLPLAYVINEKVMICHGGLFAEDGIKLQDIRKTDRFRQPPEKGIMCDLLWADPSPKSGRQPSKRGVSMSFGPDVTNKFLSENKLELLIRSHEVKNQGYEEAHNGKCITIFSAPNYCDQMGNKGAFIRLKGKQMKPKFTKFSAVSHPNIGPMAYARGFGGLY